MRRTRWRAVSPPTSIGWRCCGGRCWRRSGGDGTGRNGWGATTACLNRRSSEAGKRRLPRWCRDSGKLRAAQFQHDVPLPSLRVPACPPAGTHRHERAPSVDGLRSVCIGRTAHHLFAINALRIRDSTQKSTKSTLLISAFKPQMQRDFWLKAACDPARVVFVPAKLFRVKDATVLRE